MEYSQQRSGIMDGCSGNSSCGISGRNLGSGRTKSTVNACVEISWTRIFSGAIEMLRGKGKGEMGKESGVLRRAGFVLLEVEVGDDVVDLRGAEALHLEKYKRYPFQEREEVPSGAPRR